MDTMEFIFNFSPRPRPQLQANFFHFAGSAAAGEEQARKDEADRQLYAALGRALSFYGVRFRSFGYGANSISISNSNFS